MSRQVSGDALPVAPRVRCCIPLDSGLFCIYMSPGVCALIPWPLHYHVSVRGVVVSPDTMCSPLHLPCSRHASRVCFVVRYTHMCLRAHVAVTPDTKFGPLHFPWLVSVSLTCHGVLFALPRARPCCMFRLSHGVFVSSAIGCAVARRRLSPSFSF